MGDAPQSTTPDRSLADDAAGSEARQRLELLALAGEVLSRSLDRQETLDAIARTIVPRIADWCRVDLVDEHGFLQRAVTHHADADRSRFGEELVRGLRAAPGTPGSMAWAVATGQSHLAHFDPPVAYDRIRDRDLLTFAAAIGMRAYYVVPLVARGRTLGALAALQAESGRGFGAADCAMLDELGQRAALALDNARLYTEAEAARRQAERANRAKDEFLGILGHELRNPLAPIVMALKVMELRDASANAEERRIIERQVAHLSRLVDDLLDVSRITQGKVELRRERVSLASVVAKALELTQPIYERRSQPVALDVADDDATVWGDELRLAQVVSNLLINAAKFTPPTGAVRMRLRAADDGFAEIVVADEGDGIAPELLPRVFDLFVQGEQALDRRSGGLGLGLAIVRTLVQMHGGSVGVASEGIGQGTTFTVRLPLAGRGAALPIAAPPADTARRREGRLLVVDDNRDAAESVAALLRAFGYDVATAHEADAAMRAIAAFAPEAAILDIGLPGTDGYVLATQLRDREEGGQLRLVALTGYGRAHDRDRALAAGFDEHLVKPVEPERLLDTLDRLLAPRRRDGSARR